MSYISIGNLAFGRGNEKKYKLSISFSAKPEAQIVMMRLRCFTRGKNDTVTNNTEGRNTAVSGGQREGCGSSIEEGTFTELSGGQPLSLILDI